MALTDWTQQQDSGAQGATTSQAETGSKSYEMQGGSGTPIITLDQSETDAPTEGQITSQVYYPSNGSVAAAVVRFQDTSNYYQIELDTAANAIILNSVTSGSLTNEDSASISTPATSTWHKIEFIAWESGGNFNARVTANGSQLGSDLSDGSNQFSGGALGFIEDSGTDDTYWDETEVFY
jgi:hypothetical protein